MTAIWCRLAAQPKDVGRQGRGMGRRRERQLLVPILHRSLGRLIWVATCLPEAVSIDPEAPRNGCSASPVYTSRLMRAKECLRSEVNLEVTAHCCKECQRFVWPRLTECLPSRFNKGLPTEAIKSLLHVSFRAFFVQTSMSCESRAAQHYKAASRLWCCARRCGGHPSEHGGV